MSVTYPQIETALDKIIISFKGIDWDYFNVLGLIESIKEIVPKESRDYDPETHTWAFDKEYAPIVDNLIEQHFGLPKT